MRGPPKKEGAPPAGNGDAPLDFIAVDNCDRWEDGPDRHRPQGLLPIGLVVDRIVQRLGQHFRLIEGGRL